MRVVLDTPVLVPALLFGGLPEALLRRGLAGAFTISSEALLDEFEDLLIRRFAFACSRARLTRDDDRVLAAALAGSADVIVTGDKDLLVLEEHEGVAILAPRSFSDALR